MNPAFPPNIPVRPSAEKRFRGLIISAQVLSILVFIGIVLVLGWTAQQKGKRFSEDLERMQSMEMDVVAPDIDPVSDDFDIDAQKSSNHIQYALIKVNTPDTTANRYDLISTLEYLRSASDDMCSSIRELRTGFNDTLYYAADDYETSESYFIRTGRAKELKTQLYVYRENIVSRMSEISPSSESGLRDAMPLDDTPASDYVTAWDEDEFSYSPSAVKQYLHDLELQVRTFESTAQNKFPQTVSDPDSY